MKAHSIVSQLLETEDEDDDFDPQELLSGGLEMGRVERIKQVFPSELHDALRDAPLQFVQAYKDPNGMATWQATQPGEWWLAETGQPDEKPWVRYKYYTNFTIFSGKLYVEVHYIDEEGRDDITQSTLYSYSAYEDLQRMYSRCNWLDKLASYAHWVCFYKLDPLGFFGGLQGKNLQAAALARRHELKNEMLSTPHRLSDTLPALT